MAFVGNTELILLEIGLVCFVGVVIPETVKYLIRVSRDYETLTQDIGFAPVYWIYVALMYSILAIFEPLAVYRIRLYGNWVSGVNLSALVVFWILQLFLLLFNTFNTNWPWTAVIFGFVSLGLAIATTWLFFQLEILAGILMVVVCAIFLFILILEIAIAFKNNGIEQAVGYVKNQATWNGKIGAVLPESAAVRPQNVNAQRKKTGAQLQRPTNPQQLPTAAFHPAKKIPQFMLSNAFATNSITNRNNNKHLETV